MGENRIAIRVDRILGQEEIVVKSMGDLLADHPMFSGVTISGRRRVDPDRRRSRPPAREQAALAGPGDRGAAQTQSRDEERGDAAVEGKRRKMRVLYIDDSLSVRKAAEKLLKGSGRRGARSRSTASTGSRSAARARSTWCSPTSRCRALNGYDMVRELRYVPGLQGHPVVVVTSPLGREASPARDRGRRDRLRHQALQPGRARREALALGRLRPVAARLSAESPMNTLVSAPTRTAAEASSCSTSSATSGSWQSTPIASSASRSRTPSRRAAENTAGAPRGYLGIPAHGSARVRLLGTWRRWSAASRNAEPGCCSADTTRAPISPSRCAPAACRTVGRMSESALSSLPRGLCGFERRPFRGAFLPNTAQMGSAKHVVAGLVLDLERLFLRPELDWSRRALSERRRKS
jgi:CheY-like chemotaxis protein